MRDTDLLPALAAVMHEDTLAALRGERLRFDFFESPFGRCLIAQHGGLLCWLSFAGDDDTAALADMQAAWPGVSFIQDAAGCVSLAARLLHGHEALPIALFGTPFQRQVWHALLDIPAGETTSYGALAQRIGRPSAARAVGAAVGANPISWIVPCHRVVLKDGRVHNYRWGVEVKRALLKAEVAAFRLT